MGHAAMLQRKCSCGGQAKAGGECEECKKKRTALQRKPASSAHGGSSLAPPIVHDVLRSSGRPLAPQTQKSMEKHFGHDFSRVRVHTDAQAAKSTRAVDAKAWTVGRHIAFDSGQHSVSTMEGRSLLAHELSHVVQQRGKRRETPLQINNSPGLERESEAAAQSVTTREGHATPVISEAPTALQRSSSSRSSSSQSSSSRSSNSSANNEEEVPEKRQTSTGPCRSAQVDVRATHIGGSLRHLPIWHLFVIFKDSAGTEWFYRGGPGGTCPGHSSGYGTIMGTHGRYLPGTVDWDPSAPSTTVLSGSGACGKDACFRRELARIDGTCTPYRPLSPNSNTVVSTLLSNCGVPRKKPVLIAPGWGSPNI